MRFRVWGRSHHSLSGLRSLWVHQHSCCDITFTCHWSLSKPLLEPVLKHNGRGSKVAGEAQGQLLVLRGSVTGEGKGSKVAGEAEGQLLVLGGSLPCPEEVPPFAVVTLEPVLKHYRRVLKHHRRGSKVERKAGGHLLVLGGASLSRRICLGGCGTSISLCHSSRRGARDAKLGLGFRV